jgi:hypothetical protein
LPAGDVEIPRYHQEGRPGGHQAENRHLLEDVLDIIEAEKTRIDESGHHGKGCLHDEQEDPLVSENGDGSLHVRLR